METLGIQIRPIWTNLTTKMTIFRVENHVGKQTCVKNSEKVLNGNGALLNTFEITVLEFSYTVF